MMFNGKTSDYREYRSDEIARHSATQYSSAVLLAIDLLSGAEITAPQGRGAAPIVECSSFIRKLP